MRSFTVIILHAYLAMAPAKEVAEKHSANKQDFVDALVDKLIDKLFGRVMPTQSLMSQLTPMVSPRGTPLGQTALPNFASRSEVSRPQVRVDAMPLRSSSMFPTVPALSASRMPGLIDPGMSVQAMQDVLARNGVPPSPLQKLALTQVASTRDPSMKAQVREVFNTLDPATQAKVRKASEEIIVRAAALEGETSLNLEDMAGITEPLGLWDPLGLAVDAPNSRLYFYRECELKNGRAAMMAFVGIIVTSPNALGFKPFFSGPWDSFLTSHFTDPEVNAKFWPALLFASGAFELFSYPDRSKAPGDLGFDPLGLKPKKESEFLEMQNKELNNGRLAMFAMAGLYGHELMAGVKQF